MNELLALFNITALDDNDIGHLMRVLNSPSYARVFRPYLENIKNASMRMLLDPAQKRKDEASDDFLRGTITTVEGLLTLFTRLLNETNFERIAESQSERRDELEYAAASAAAVIRPMGVNVNDQKEYDAQVGSDQYRPEEDF